MNIYAFDVDETLEVSGGPVLINDLWHLRKDGHILGICGNFQVGTHRIHRWDMLFSFVGQMEMPKERFLMQVKTYLPPAEDYIMVGNDDRFFGASKDYQAAQAAGWRFLRESEFASGLR